MTVDAAAMLRCEDAEMSNQFDILRISRDRTAPPKLHYGSYLWLGDLEDWHVAGDYDGFVYARHVPCWKPQPGGIALDMLTDGPFLANIVADALLHRCEAPAPRDSTEVLQLRYLCHAMNALGGFIRHAPLNSEQLLRAGDARKHLAACSVLVSPKAGLTRDSL